MPGLTPASGSFAGDILQQSIAQGPDVIVATFETAGGLRRLLGFRPAPNAAVLTFTQSLQTFGALNRDATRSADQPSVWGARVAFRETIAGNDSDLFVREPGPDGVLDTVDDRGVDGILGTADDPFITVVGDDALAQFYPQLSGDNLAWLACATPACDNAGEPRLFVANTGSGGRFGDGNDIVRELTQATNIDRLVPIRLYTPGTPGRPACRNVVAWAGTGADPGVHVITTGPDGLFDADDPPVQVTQFEAAPGSTMFAFDVNDDIVAASNNFAPPFMEIVTGGPDGCLTRTDDNLSFDSTVQTTGRRISIHGGRIVSSRFEPTIDLVAVDLNAERVLWPRDEGAQFNGDAEADDDAVVLGGGGVFNFERHTVERAFNRSDQEADSSSGTILHAEGGVFFATPDIRFQPLTLLERGDDERWGTADDTSLLLSAQRPLASDQDVLRSRSGTFGLDSRVAVWGGAQQVGSFVVPVVHSAGRDGVFSGAGGDDCEAEVGPASNGYAFARASNRRQAFLRCSDVGCSAVVGEVLVREPVVGNNNCGTANNGVCEDPGACAPGTDSADCDAYVCGSNAAVATVTPVGFAPDLDGPRLIYVSSQTVRLVTGGGDGQLTTTGDNTDVRLSRNLLTTTEGPRISGDRVVWVDSTFETPRVMVADLADGSERVFSSNTQGATSVSIAGDVISWGTGVAGTVFAKDVMVGFVGLQPDAPRDARAAGPTRLRCPEDDRFEENDSTLTATALNSGASVAGIVCRDDVDLYRVDVPSTGCTVRAKARFVHADGDIDIELLAPNGVRLDGSAGTTNDESITFKVLAGAGQHFVRVAGFRGAENTYDVGVTVSCP